MTVSEKELEDLVKSVIHKVKRLHFDKGGMCSTKRLSITI